jgi:hypothetical protein
MGVSGSTSNSARCDIDDWAIGFELCQFDQLPGVRIWAKIAPNRK